MELRIEEAAFGLGYQVPMRHSVDRLKPNPSHREWNNMRNGSEEQSRNRFQEPRLHVGFSCRALGGLAIAGLLSLKGYGGQIDLSFVHSTSGDEMIYSFPGNGSQESFDILNLSVLNSTGQDWTSYTIGLPVPTANQRGLFGGVSIVNGSFTDAFVTPDWGMIGLSGGVVSSGESFAVSFGIYHRSQDMVGLPTFRSDPINPPNIEYELPNDLPAEIPEPPPISEWPDVSYSNDSDEVSEPPPSPPQDSTKDWWTLKSKTTVKDGALTWGASVGYRQTPDGSFEYTSLTPDGYAGPTGVFTGSLEDLLTWREGYLNGSVDPYAGPTPEPEVYALVFGVAFGGLALGRKYRWRFAPRGAGNPA